MTAIMRAFSPSSAALFLATGAALLGCDSKHGPSLPPLDGPGAPAAPAIVAPEPVAADEESGALDRASTGTLRARRWRPFGPRSPA